MTTERFITELCRISGTDPDGIYIKGRKEGWLDEQYHPLLSRAKSAVLADHIAELLGIHQKWKVFESFWRRNNMRGDYNDALNQKQYSKFYEKMNKIICL